jgi:zona occludens toxin (predicted ATPase)
MTKNDAPIDNSTGQMEARATAGCSSVTPTPTGSCPANFVSTNKVMAPTDNDQQQVNDLKVSAYPNPYTNVVNFQFASPKTGKAVLEVYDLLGRKIAVVYQGNVNANVPVQAKLNVPALSRVPLVYKLTVNDKAVRGSILPDKN